jgi:hypothetical protein
MVTNGNENSTSMSSVILCAACDIHVAIDPLCADVLAYEAELGVRFDLVFHVGDFGIWPDARRVDKATRNHDGAGDFPAWYAEQRAVPWPTVFIKGNHEDFEWHARRRRDCQLEVPPASSTCRTGKRWRSRLTGSVAGWATSGAAMGRPTTPEAVAICKATPSATSPTTKYSGSRRRDRSTSSSCTTHRSGWSLRGAARTARSGGVS